MKENSPENDVELAYDPPGALTAFWSSQLERIKHRAESNSNRTPPRLECNVQIRCDSYSTNDTSNGTASSR